MSFFFISYKKPDEHNYAHELSERLTKEGLPTWMDINNIRTGEQWWNSINDMIAASIGLIVVLTESALNSHYVTYEWTRAKTLGKELIVLQYESIDADILDRHPISHFQHYPLFTERTVSAWTELFNCLHDIKEKRNIPTTVLAAEQRLLEPDPDKWSGAIRTLEVFEHPSATEALARQINSMSPEVCALAGIALGRRTNCRDQRAIPGLIRRIEISKARSDDANTQEALRCLGQIGGNEAARHLIRFVTSWGAHQIPTNTAVQALGFTESPEAEQFLLNMVRETRHPFLFKESIKALGNLKSTTAIPILLDYLLTENHRQEALAALGRIGNADVIPELLECWQNTFRHNITDTQELINALVHIGGRPAEEALLEMKKRARDTTVYNRISKALDDLDIDSV